MAEKTCRSCGVTKSIEEFHRRRDERQPVCKSCRADYRRAYHAANRERERETNRVWRAVNVEKVGADVQAWRVANPEKLRETTKEWRAAHRDNVLAWKQNYRERHPDRVAERHAFHLLKKRGMEPEYVDYTAILKRDGMVCHICQGEVTRESLSFDHVIPLSKGGPHTFDNIRVAHMSCNNKKHARLPESNIDVTFCRMGD